MFHGDIDQATAKGLKVLRERIAAAKIPSSMLDESINVATWNIREFGKVPRKDAAIHLIAEVIGQFDVVSVVELRDRLGDLARTLQILGPTWRAVYSDYITDAGGNRERIAFLYDKRAATFTGLAAEADPPRKKVGGEYVSAISWWRPPFMASFRAGNFDFVLIAAHIRWGDEDAATRVPELKLLAEWIDKRRKDASAEDKDIVLLGDFNIPSRDDPTFKALTSKGLQIPTGLIQDTFGSNLAKDMRYDQILHTPVHKGLFTDDGGVLDFYAGDHQALFPGTTMSKLDFTYQLSDHLPLWIRVDTDVAGVRLDQILRQ